MLRTGRITAEHVKKLDHTIDEIRLRALDNIISKYNLGFLCDCETIKREIVLKLFNWFSFQSVPQPEKVLNFLLQLVQADDYVNAFGKLRFQNKLHKLKEQISPKWHAKLDEIREAILHTESEINETNLNSRKGFANIPPESDTYARQMPQFLEFRNEGNSGNKSDSKCENKREGTIFQAIKWLEMPWQPLVASDKAVLTAVEEALNNTTDTNLIVHTCQFIMNVMMQDFPAEVFLQRPAIVMTLHSFLQSNADVSNPNAACVIPIVLKTLRKLTRALRFRIYYYCEPCIANKEQKLLAEKLDSNVCAISEAGDGTDNGMPEINYQTYQSAGTSDRSQSINEIIGDYTLHPQLLLPFYCTKSLRYVLSQLSIPADSTLPLRNVKYIIDVAYELVQLLMISITSDIWNESNTEIQNELQMLFNLLGDIIKQLYDQSNKDYLRITYLHLITITIQLLHGLVSSNIRKIAIPHVLQECMVQIEMDAQVNLLYPDLYYMFRFYAHEFQSCNTSHVQSYSHMIDKLSWIVEYTKKTFSLSEYTLKEQLQILTAISKKVLHEFSSAIVEIALKCLRDNWKQFTNYDIDMAATNLIVILLNHVNKIIYRTTYVQCHSLVKSILGVEDSEGKIYSWENLLFLLKPKVLTFIITDGATSSDKEINNLSKEILLFILEGKEQMGKIGWSKTINAIVPVLQLLQCHADLCTPLGQCIIKLFDPAIADVILLPYIEILKGNIRFLYSSDLNIRKEASRRLIIFLNQTESQHKLPNASNLHESSLHSRCIVECQRNITDMSYEQPASALQNIISQSLQQLQTNDNPQERKNYLNKLSVIMTNIFNQEVFLQKDGLALILDIFNKALIKDNYENDANLVIPILNILKSLSSYNHAVRRTLFSDLNILLNIIRSLILRIDDTNVVELLCLLTYSTHDLEYCIEKGEQLIASTSKVSLPYIVVKTMKVPFRCSYFLKPTNHNKIALSICDNPCSNFLKIKLTWEFNDRNMLWKCINDLKLPELINKQEFIISKEDLLSLQYSYLQYCCQKQLYNIQNSTTHNDVLCALDYLTMYLKLYEVLPNMRKYFLEDIDSLPWEQTFERFLSHPTNKADRDLFVDILNFLHLYCTVRKNDGCLWISKIVKNMTKSLADLFKNLEVDNQSIHQSIFKLVRTCSAIEEKSNDKSKNNWIQFIEFVVSTLCFGDQQHFYNLAYLDWLLTCLTYLIRQCEWGNHKNLLISLCNTLIELIISFHGAGTVSFMGLSITRNSIICLNHLLHQMQINVDKTWTEFWHEEGRSLSWLPTLWQNRDPLVRASALQLLAGLMNIVYTMPQLLNAIAMTPNDLCYTLLQYIANREECCLVKEEACIAFSAMLKNYNTTTLHCDDSLQLQTILIYIEQQNIYHEISVLCSNIYSLPTIDIKHTQPLIEKKKQLENQQDIDKTSMASISETSTYYHKHHLPLIIQRLYCQNESQLPFSMKELTSSEYYLHNYIATPALITAICTFLNNLILIGEHEVVRQIYEHNIDKYLFWCLDEIPKIIETKKDLDDYSEKLEMYINICTVLTNSIRHSKEYTIIVTFPRDLFYVLFCFLHIDLYQSTEPRVIYLRNRLWTEIYNFIASLSLVEDDQYLKAIRSALKLCKPAKLLHSIYFAIKNSAVDLRMNAITCLSFFLSLEVQENYEKKENCEDQKKKKDWEKEDMYLRNVLDTTMIHDETLKVVTCLVDSTSDTSKSKKDVKSDSSEEHDYIPDNKPSDEKQMLGSKLCELLLHFFTAYNYVKSKKNSKQMEDKDLVTSALTNLLYVSKRAKQKALQNDLPKTTVQILKEMYVKLNIQFERCKKEAEKKTPLLHDMNCIFMLLMNFMYESEYIKQQFIKEGLVDVMHKLWVWISLNKTVLISALKLLATFTTKSSYDAIKSLTTIIPESGLRRTPNTRALIHAIIQTICEETERSDQQFDYHKIHYAFHILRNAVHHRECRVFISKSNILKLFTTIHPIVNKRTRSWVLIEMYFLEFLIDFTYYQEGQQCVPKATDALDVLIHLAKDPLLSIKVLAIAILRNLAFNATNRSQLLNSVDFINLMQDIFKNESSNEVKLAGTILWSLICNNQKGKLIIRSAGFFRSIRQAVSRFTLQNDIEKVDPDVYKILFYLLSILDSDNSNNEN